MFCNKNNCGQSAAGVGKCFPLRDLQDFLIVMKFAAEHKAGYSFSNYRTLCNSPAREVDYEAIRESLARANHYADLAARIDEWYFEKLSSQF